MISDAQLQAALDSPYAMSAPDVDAVLVDLLKVRRFLRTITRGGTEDWELARQIVAWDDQDHEVNP